MFFSKNRFNSYLSGPRSDDRPLPSYHGLSRALCPSLYLVYTGPNLSRRPCWLLQTTNSRNPTTPLPPSSLSSLLPCPHRLTLNSSTRSIHRAVDSGVVVRGVESPVHYVQLRTSHAHALNRWSRRSLIRLYGPLRLHRRDRPPIARQSPLDRTAYALMRPRAPPRSIGKLYRPCSWILLNVLQRDVPWDTTFKWPTGLMTASRHAS